MRVASRLLRRSYQWLALKWWSLEVLQCWGGLWLLEG